MKIRLVLVIILVLVTCYLAAPRVLSWKAHTILEQLGCEQSHALFENPQWDSLIIRQLTLKDCPDLSINQLSASKVFLGFSPKRLLLEQQLDLLELTALQADISLTPSQEDNSSDSTAPMLAASMPAVALEELFKRLPVDRITIDVKRLRASIPEHKLELTGHLDITPEQLKSKAVLELDQYPALAIEFEGNQQNQIHLAVSDRQTQIYNMNAELLLEEVADNGGPLIKKFAADIRDRLNLPAALSYLNQASLAPEILQSNPQPLVSQTLESSTLNSPALEYQTIESTVTGIPETSLSPSVRLMGESRSHWLISATVDDFLKVGWKAISVTQQLEAELDLSLDAREVQRVRGPLKAQLSWQPDKIEWKLQEGTLLDINLMPGLLPHTALANHWQLEPKDDLAGELKLDPEVSLKSSNGKLLIQSIGEQELNTDTYFSHFRWQAKSAYAHFDTKLGRQQLVTPSMAFRQLEAHGKGTLAIADSLISMNLEAGSYLTAEELTAITSSPKPDTSPVSPDANPKSTVEQLKLVTNTPLQLRTHFGQTSWLLSPIKVNLASSGINVASETGSAIQTEAVSGQLSLKRPQNSTELTGQLDLKLHQLNVENWSASQLKVSLPYRFKYPLFRFQLTASLPHDNDQSIDSLQPNRNIRVNGKGHINLENQALRSEWLLPPVDLQQLINLSPTSITSQIPKWTIEGGQISGAANLVSNTVNKSMHWKLDADIGVTGLNLRNPNWYVSGAKGAFQLNTGSNAELNGNGVVGVDRVEGALTLTNVTGAFGLSPSSPKEIKVYQARMNLLGGSIHADAFSFPLEDKSIATKSLIDNVTATPSPSTELHLNGLDLSKILALQPKADISGNGYLDGTLPLSITPNGLSINDGYVAAQAPGGMLAYRPAGADALASGNYGLDIAMKVLEAFHYKALALTVNYQPDGTLILDTALKGHNPDWQNGQPIDFNIRIEQNLLKLLKAIQFSSNLTEDLEKRIQQGRE